MLRQQGCVFLFEWETPLVCPDSTNSSGCQLTDSQLQFTFDLRSLSEDVQVSGRDGRHLQLQVCPLTVLFLLSGEGGLGNVSPPRLRRRDRTGVQTKRSVSGVRLRVQQIGLFVWDQQSHEHGLQTRGAGPADEVRRRRSVPTRYASPEARLRDGLCHPQRSSAAKHCEDCFYSADLKMFSQ